MLSRGKLLFPTYIPKYFRSGHRIPKVQELFAMGRPVLRPPYDFWRSKRSTVLSLWKRCLCFFLLAHEKNVLCCAIKMLDVSSFFLGSSQECLSCLILMWSKEFQFFQRKMGGFSFWQKTVNGENVTDAGMTVSMKIGNVNVHVVCNVMKTDETTLLLKCRPLHR